MMDSGCGNNSRVFDQQLTSIMSHGDPRIPCSSLSAASPSLWASTDCSKRPSFHDPSSSSPTAAYFDMPSSFPTPPLTTNRTPPRRRPRGRPATHTTINKEDHNELRVAEDASTDPDADCTYKKSVHGGSGNTVLSGKKRRLTAEQVQFLERSFEVENKLEPERKAKLASEIGLEPRQVAIWFQNRRARFKTKTIEREFDGLRNRYDLLKGEYENVVKEKERLQEEVSVLIAKLQLRETTDSDPLPSSNHTTTGVTHQTAAVVVSTAAPLEVKQEEAASSAKSDVLDSDSPPPPPRSTVAAECNFYNYYYYNSTPPETATRVDEEKEEDDDEKKEVEFQLTRSLFPQAAPPAPYDGFHRGFGGLSTSPGEVEGDDQFTLRPSLWPWSY